MDILQLLTYVEVDMECYWTVNVILTDAKRRSIWLSLLFNSTPCLPKHKSTIVLLYNKCMLCISCHFKPLKRWRYGWIMRNYLTFWRHFPVNITSCQVVLCYRLCYDQDGILLQSLYWEYTTLSTGWSMIVIVSWSWCTRYKIT